MTIYALKVSDKEEDIGRVFESLRGGEGRFGWSYVPTADLRELRDRIGASGWESLTDDERDCYAKQEFLLDLAPGDHAVYVNVPRWVQCAVGRVTGTYEWRFEDDDFNHRFTIDPDSVKTFDRNSEIVPAALSRRLKLQGRWWRVYAETEFAELLDALNEGAPTAPRTAETNLRALAKTIRPALTEIASNIQHTHPAKDLEALMELVFRNVPGVAAVRRQQGRADRGADLLVDLEYGAIPGLMETRTVAVQVKSWRGTANDTSAVDDLRRAFAHHRDTDMGLIVSTAECAGEELERELEKLREESEKPAALLIGADLAEFVLRHSGHPPG